MRVFTIPAWLLTTDELTALVERVQLPYRLRAYQPSEELFTFVNEAMDELQEREPFDADLEEPRKLS